jgi:hypothetical protein
MTAMLHQPALGIGELLVVEREEINFWNVSPERVAIEIPIHNRGDAISEPTVAVISAAPLGAFVKWRPLVTLRVPALLPGESHVLRTEAIRRFPAPLGDASKIPPHKLLTALAQDDERPPKAARQGQPVLPTDLFDLFGRGDVHYAGNLNVFVGGRDVERHLAKALRVYPGMLNFACFVVGSVRDDYSFRLVDAEGWDANLFPLGGPGLPTRPNTPIPQGEWIVVPSVAVFMLKVFPPKGCASRTIAVHVCQRSTRREAIVEFSLDPSAAGAGCYVVS